MEDKEQSNETEGIEDWIQGTDSGQRTIGIILKNLVLQALETIRTRFL
jgi:hypothetical protein